MRIAEGLRRARERLPESDSAGLDAELLLCSVLGCDRARLYARPEQGLSQTQAALFDERIERRAEGRPVAYLLGKKEFWSLALSVSEDTLIPRPETELLVERALALLPAGCAREVLDAGAGSGAIAIAIAKERPASRIIAVDNSPAALTIAQKNIAAHGLRRIKLIQADWLNFKHERPYDLIVSNPPYIAADDPHLKRGDLRFEPRAALVAGQDGLAAIRQLVPGAARHLKPGGWLLLEHGWRQGRAVRALFKAARFGRVGTLRDHNRLERVTGGQWQ